MCLPRIVIYKSPKILGLYDAIFREMNFDAEQDNSWDDVENISNCILRSLNNIYSTLYIQVVLTVQSMSCLFLL